MRLLRREGQAALESLVLLPLFLSLLTLVLGLFLLAGAVFLLEDRLEETLLCLSHRERSRCETDFRSFVQRSGLHHLNARSRFTKNGGRWSGLVELQKPWGGSFVMRRDLRTPLTDNR
ncbi:MAG: hypothetical protein KF802_06705 [Bdellovibrionaceae bacterium]|nr:hypothetical protein [Pseudobdellovibrionaceae bacterium]MBX3034404.1 hypothetical protein [Pseudobdellovibrionaceae bacterium]